MVPDAVPADRRPHAKLDRERNRTDPTRLLLLLVDETGAVVGTIGLMHLDQDPIEVDNILRGDRRGDPI